MDLRPKVKCEVSASLASWSRLSRPGGRYPAATLDSPSSEYPQRASRDARVASANVPTRGCGDESLGASAAAAQSLQSSTSARGLRGLAPRYRRKNVRL